MKRMTPGRLAELRDYVRLLHGTACGPEARELLQELDAVTGERDEALAKLYPPSHACKLCGKPRLPVQVFCGAACSARWEAGARPVDADGDQAVRDYLRRVDQS